jgi:hypothetical protein
MKTPVFSQPALPSRRKLAVTTALAVAGAAIILVTLVLPAEYAIDPLHTGRALGLTRIAAPPAPVAEPSALAGEAFTPVQNGPVGMYARPYQRDTAQFVLGPYDFVEYKYHLEKGATMVFAWTSSAPVMHDFHGDPAAAPDSPVSFEKKDRREASGAFTAPFTGIHGWYWENPTAEPVTIMLTSAGFYSLAIEFRSDRTRHPHQLIPVVLPSATGNKETR